MMTKLEIVMFLVGVSAINLSAIDVSGNPFLRNARIKLLPGVNVQESEANILTPRITNNVKDDDLNTENLGGYRPLFPPYFPLNNPFPSNKVYFDQEYYTRGTDELNFPSNANLDRDNFARSQPVENLQPIPVQQNFPSIGTTNNNDNNNNNNIRTFQKTSSSVTNVRTLDPSTKNVDLLPIFKSWSSDFKFKGDHEVSFITYQ
ncbi:probable protein kinase DDB_G0277539 [Belonocnema kinseyi]|uniref:probable protein kinase DDB_G0277539 n=1 Tax=Belonocnema kinseyi TaxID=2817044 RepID=UPI00143CDD6C|nr:probable protein kinase DDB_G0277539 [Belonocnema kinseyi]